LKGIFSPPEEIATETDTPIPNQSLKFTAIRTIRQFDLNGDHRLGEACDRGHKRYTFSATTWFDAVQTPTTGAVSALTCTPSPADGAASVAVSVSPTLTFNNALRTGVTGIQLVNGVTGAIVPSAITIDATLKIITIDPNSNLTAANTHIITISGAVDIYGQALALTAYDFTTA
jgi:hypothetical protein